jgi:hypothetical protein
MLVSKNIGKKLTFEDFREFKVRFFEKERTRLRNIFKSGGCNDLKFRCGDYGIKGQFTTSKGITYHFDSGDVRHLGYVRLVLKTNNGLTYSCGVNRHELLDFLSQ